MSLHCVLCRTDGPVCQDSQCPCHRQVTYVPCECRLCRTMSSDLGTAKSIGMVFK